MKVYVVNQEPYHDNGNVLGVYSSLEKAEAAHPGPWSHDDWYIANRSRCVAYCKVECGDDIFIYEFEVDAQANS
jgi:hypothetical protein